jgi:hypothetical protein
MGNITFSCKINKTKSIVPVTPLIIVDNATLAAYNMKIIDEIYNPLQFNRRIHFKFTNKNINTFECDLINTLKYLINKYAYIDNSRFCVKLNNKLYYPSFKICPKSEKLMQIVITIQYSNKIWLADISTDTENREVTELSRYTKKYVNSMKEILLNQIFCCLDYDYHMANKLIDVLILNYNGQLYELFKCCRSLDTHTDYFISYAMKQKYRELTDKDHNFIMQYHPDIIKQLNKYPNDLKHFMCQRCNNGILISQNHLKCKPCCIIKCPLCGLDTATVYLPYGVPKLDSRQKYHECNSCYDAYKSKLVLSSLNN